jgi:MFS family permease
LSNHPDFRLLWSASFAASMSNWMQQIAIGWLALNLTDSAFFVSVVSFMAGLPFIVVAIPAGSIIDRVDR